MRMLTFIKRGLAALSLTLITALPTQAAQIDDAQALVQDMAKQAITILGDETKDQEGKIAGFDEILSRDVDLDFVARFTLGRYWRGVPQDKLDNYVSIYKTYLIRTNASRLSAYSGQTIEVVNAIEEKPGRYIVKSVIKQNGAGEDIQIDWRVRDRGEDGLKIVDIIIEGISMALTQRSEFAAVMQKSRGDIDPLISVMEKRIGESKADAAKQDDA